MDEEYRLVEINDVIYIVQLCSQQNCKMYHKFTKVDDKITGTTIVRSLNG